MSAVLSRRILADLLEEFAGKTQYGLADRIDSFNEDTKQPYGLRKNLHYLREIADLSAHTKRDDQAEIVEVTQEEAEWTLDIIERLFDYFIITPARDASLRESFDQKLERANRKAIKPLPDDPTEVALDRAGPEAADAEDQEGPRDTGADTGGILP